ncbi:hypothetical protein ACH5RR_005013 [Cinchona calisaya]|uniref:Uncharacterized protein n=1 Tax=Cinchona calisaya TaxID=153742 RepID=A0ABD3AZ71_9GENT
MAKDGSEEFRVVSPSIDNEGRLPRKYTGEGHFAAFGVDIDASDPDGPIVRWAHWVVINIPPPVKGLPEGVSGKEDEIGGEYAGIKEGNNDWKVPGWRGPVLPNHGHRFEFKLYALDAQLHLGNKVTKEKVVEEIEGHVLGEAVLMANF